MKLLFDLFLIVCAVIPPSLFLIYIYFKDKAEKEPLWLLALLFFGGMLTVIPDIIFEVIPEVILRFILDPSSIVFRVLMNFFVIALVEEFFKYTVMFSCTFFSKHFNYRFDGIVYAVFTSLGMAMLENVLYVLQHGFLNAIMRAVLSIPGHAFFAIFMGYYYGLAKQAQIEKKYWKMSYYLVVSLVVPILMHGFYDYCADWGNWLRVLLFFMFVIFMYFAAFIRVHISSKKDEAFVKDQTTVYMTYAQASSIAYVYPDPNRRRNLQGARPAAALPGYPGMAQRPMPGAGQARPQAPMPGAGQARPQAPMPGYGQARPQAPMQGTAQARPQAPMPGAGQARPQAPMPGAVQPRPQAPVNGTAPAPSPYDPAAATQMVPPVNAEAQGAAAMEETAPPMPVMPVDVLTSPAGEGRPPIKLSRRTSAYIFCRGCGTLCRANSFYCTACGTLIHGTGPIQKKESKM